MYVKNLNKELGLGGYAEKHTLVEPIKDDSIGWKVGAYEPTTEIHGDIEFLYVVDLIAKTIHIEGYNSEKYPQSYAGKFGTFKEPIRP